MQKFFLGDVNQARQSNLCARWSKEIVEVLMVIDKARPKIKLRFAKYRKRVQKSSDLMVMVDLLQIINRGDKIQSDLLRIGLVEKNPSAPPFELWSWRERQV